MKLRSAEYYAYLCEREQTRLNKEAGLPRPWTKDPIIEKFKFTNVRREHDRTTRALQKIYRTRVAQTASLNTILINCATFRYFGTAEFAEDLGWQDAWDAERVVAIAQRRIRDGQRVFTGAYVVTNGGISGPKHEVVTEYYLKNLYDSIIVSEVTPGTVAVETGSFESTFNILTRYDGFGGSGFMSKEVLLDTMFFKKFWPKGVLDIDVYSPVGPGARRGIARAMGGSSTDKYTKTEMLQVLRNLHAAQKEYWPKGWGHLTLSDIQFGLCEFDKHERVRLGEGRMKNTYKPYKE